jgi:hypothetical protein
MYVMFVRSRINTAVHTAAGAGVVLARNVATDAYLGTVTVCVGGAACVSRVLVVLNRPSELSCLHHGQRERGSVSHVLHQTHVEQ